MAKKQPGAIHHTGPSKVIYPVAVGDGIELIPLRVVQAWKFEVGQVRNSGCHSKEEGKITGQKHIRARGCLGVGRISEEQ